MSQNPAEEHVQQDSNEEYEHGNSDVLGPEEFDGIDKSQEEHTSEF